MFEKLGAMMNLLGNRGKIQEEIQKFQAQVGTITAEATSGAGYVTVKVNGRMEIQNVRISEEAERQFVSVHLVQLGKLAHFTALDQAEDRGIRQIAALADLVEDR